MLYHLTSLSCACLPVYTIAIGGVYFVTHQGSLPQYTHQKKKSAFFSSCILVAAVASHIFYIDYTRVMRIHVHIYMMCMIYLEVIYLEVMHKKSRLCSLTTAVMSIRFVFPHRRNYIYIIKTRTKNTDRTRLHSLFTRRTESSTTSANSCDPQGEVYLLQLM